MVKVFLGGTCNGSTWREKLIEMLKIDYFDPVVDEWNIEARKNELYARENCDYCLYTITPEMSGFYSIAEVVDDSNKRPEKTILCILNPKITYGTNRLIKDGYIKVFDKDQMRSLEAVANLVRCNRAKVFDSLEDVAKYLNGEKQ